MDEAKRFLRYITPGLVFLTETLFLLWIIEPDIAITILQSFSKESGVALVIATLLASGGVGFMFSVVHHYLHWRDKLVAVDHRKSIASLRNRKIIQLKSRTSGKNIDDAVEPNRFQAWTILCGLWHERLQKDDSIIKSADPRASSIADLVHSLGTARVAATTAWVVTLYILVQSCNSCIELASIFRFVVGNLFALGFIVIYHLAYLKTGEGAQRIIEQVLEDALTYEKNNSEEKSPIETYVELP